VERTVAQPVSDQPLARLSACWARRRNLRHYQAVGDGDANPWVVNELAGAASPTTTILATTTGGRPGYGSTLNGGVGPGRWVRSG
jgi:hypothetical protein